MAPRRSSRIHTFTLLSSLLIWCIFTTNALASGMSLTIDNGTMTLQSHNSSLSTILEGIRKQTRIEIKSFVPIEEEINADFNQIPISDGLTLLMRNYNYSFGFNDPDNQKSQLTSLYILSRVGTAQSAMVWREQEMAKNQAKGTTRAKRRLEQQLLPDHMKGIPVDANPMKSQAAIDPLVGMELPGQVVSASGQRHLQFFQPPLN